MIKELSTFVQALDSEFKGLGVKPKEGLHILLKVRQEEDSVFMDESSLVGWVYTKSKNLKQEEEVLLGRCASLGQLSWCVNTNKCFDLPTKAIHSCSPYCLAIKKENLVNGEKYVKNHRDKKSQVYERISAYFGKASDLLQNETDKQRAELFKYALNSEQSFHSWLVHIPVYSEMKDAEYVIFYLDEPVEKYQQANDVYLADKLFNTNEYNCIVEETTFGTSDFFNGYPTKKPFLTHQSAVFDIAGRVSAQEAKHLYEFQDLIGRNILPRPLPIFIYQDELKTESKKNIRDASISLFKQDAALGKRRGYKEIIEDLYKDYKDQLGNYYLLFYQAGEIKDFDFVPKFEYELKDEKGAAWEIRDLFKINYRRHIENVFDFQYAILLPVFNNALIVKTKTGDFQHRYFDDIDAKYCKSDATFLMVMTYRKAFYDFIYKSKREAVNQHTFDKIMLSSILDDIRLDEFKNNLNSQNISIRQKLNIWLSLSENFNQLTLTSETMASKLQAHRAYMKQLAKGEASIENDEQYAFAVGQVIYYLLRKSKTADRSYKRLEPFMQQVQSKELNKSIARLFDTYKHENFSTKFRTPFAEVLDYETKTNIRDLIPSILAGVFSENELFSDRENNEIKETQNETEE